MNAELGASSQRSASTVEQRRAEPQDCGPRIRNRVIRRAEAAAPPSPLDQNQSLLAAGCTRRADSIITLSSGASS